MMMKRIIPVFGIGLLATTFLASSAANAAYQPGQLSVAPTLSYAVLGHKFSTKDRFMPGVELGYHFDDTNAVQLR